MSAVLRSDEPGAEGDADIELTQMRRRHLRQVLKIEGQVYPRPWSAALFLQEIARRGDRFYIVAKAEGEVVGYAGMMVTQPEAHITTIAVDPDHQRARIGTRMMITLLEAAIERTCKSVSLEVRRSNLAAQQMYEKFGFKPVGIRRGYYIETGEDAIVMWAEGIDAREYRKTLDEIRGSISDE